MSINMKHLYELFREDIRADIKEIAEKHGLNPLQAFTRYDEAIETGLENKLEKLGVMFYGDYGLNPKVAKEFYQQFKSEIYHFLCPSWN